MVLAWVDLDVDDTDPHAARFAGDPAELYEALDVLLDLVRRGRPAWWAQAACRGKGTDVFFPERGESAAPAKLLCAGCPVRSECLDAGVDEDHGVWGGTSARQRRQLRRQVA